MTSSRKYMSVHKSSSASAGLESLTVCLLIVILPFFFSCHIIFGEKQLSVYVGLKKKAAAALAPVHNMSTVSLLV